MACRRRRAPISTRTSSELDAARMRLSRDPAQGAEQLRARAPRRRARSTAQLGAERDGAQRLHHPRPARRGPGRSRSARSAPAADQRSATSAAISWRRSAAQLIGRFGEETERRRRTASMPAACGSAPRSTWTMQQRRRDRASRRPRPLRARPRLARSRALDRHRAAIGARGWRLRISASAIPTGARRSCCRTSRRRGQIGFTDGSTGDPARLAAQRCRSAARGTPALSARCAPA